MSDNGKSKTLELIEILERGGIHSIHELMEELGVDERRVRGIVKILRDRHNKGKEIPWIHATGRGFTLTTSPSSIIKESSRRLKMSAGVMMNGIPVFSKAKKIASSQLASLRVQHNAEFIKIGKIL
jgi:hypothetical protein